MVLKVGERKVYTTPSSLANRMGVVKGQTGDGFAYAADAIAKTLDGFAKRQAVVEEENWKNDFKLKTYQSLSKFARENPSSPTDYMAQSSSYIETSISEAPDKFKSWAKSYAGMMSSQNFNNISIKAINKKQMEAKKLFKESAINEIADMNDLILNTSPTDFIKETDLITGEKKEIYNGESFTKLYGENILPRISELVTSYTKLYNSLEPNFLTDMVTPEQYMRSLKVGFEQSRVIASAKDFLDQAISLQSEGYIGSKVTGWTSEGAVDKAMDILGEDMEKYLFNPDAAEDAGPFTFTDTSAEERSLIKNEVMSWANTYYKEFKVAEKTLTNLEEANLEISITNDTNYGFNALNSSTKFWTDDEFNTYVQQNYYEKATTEQLIILRNAYNEGVITRNAIELNNNFLTTVGSIQAQLNNYSSEKKAQIELNVINSRMSNYMLQLNKSRDNVDTHNNGVVNPNDFNVDVIVIKNEQTGKLTMVDVLPDSFQAAVNLASIENVVHPQLKNMLQSSLNVNTESTSDLNQLYKISQIHSNLVNRFGTSLDLVDNTVISDSLLDFWKDVKNKPDDISLKFYGEKFLSKVNPNATNYDEKKALIINIMNKKEINFAQIIEEELVPSSGWLEDAWRYLNGQSRLSTMPERSGWMKFAVSLLPYGGDGSSQILEEERKFIFDNGDMKNKFNEYAYEYLIAMNPDINKITPMHFQATGFFDIENWSADLFLPFSDASDLPLGNEAGSQGVRAIRYAFQRLGKEGYGME